MSKDLQHKKILNKLEGFSIPWEKDKEELFRELEPQLTEDRKKPIIKLSPTWIRSAAAVAIILIASVLFVRFYEKDIQLDNGEHLSHQLPDGSIIELNSSSDLSYKPYWWGFSRKLKFEGEGFFLVQKGKSFTVESETAITKVLGTSFTILSRNNNYKVVCHTGKVEVESMLTKAKALLEPNDMINLVSGEIQNQVVLETLPNPSPWISGIYEYTGTSIIDVLEELQRQYGVTINYPKNIKYNYTGELNLNRDFEASLNLVCKPFKITFEQVSENVYKLIESPEKN